MRSVQRGFSLVFAVVKEGAAWTVGDPYAGCLCYEDSNRTTITHVGVASALDDLTASSSVSAAKRGRLLVSY